MTQTAQPGDPLTLEQWRALESLTASLTPAQAFWLSGYFTGVDAGLRKPPSQPASTMPGSQRGLTILYGTETGNAVDLARRLEENLRAAGLASTLVDMADYKVRQLGSEADILLIASTYGEGDPPQPATGFFEFIEGRKAPKLDHVRFAVLALGDSTYEYYCEAGKRLDRRFEELSAQRLFPRVDCDVDYEDAAARWMGEAIACLTAEVVGSSAPLAATPTVQGAGGQAAYDKRNPFPALVVENIAIVGRGSTKETRHIEISLAGSGLTYEPGDALGIQASNDPQVVAELLAAAGLSAETQVELKGEQVNLGNALAHHYEVTAATPRFLEYWAKLSGAGALAQLQQDDRAGDRSVFLRTHHIVDIVRRFPVSALVAQGFVSALRPLQPRLYSLASSLAVTHEEAHVTVAPLRYDLHGSMRSGVASGMLADRMDVDGRLPVYIQSNPHFRLPADDVPIIMIGAGTGVAPYRSFLQEREARGADGKSWLFFGERNFRSDFLYQTDWQGWLKDGTLTRMDVAFSRDRIAEGREKTYVQHRMEERAHDLFDWLEDGAHIYVCGDAAHLAPDVHETLIDIVAQQAHTGREAAEDYVRSLQADHRYQRDVY
ncbi:MAG: assimilatory sulfite reductase (NADPH) flavoprotein subunit [Rhizobium sp.]|nr:MAG: assimilatory sulfite reductase (NADPH) flavoprotein subunit [Rhizobium sp.]